jgi:hypothetical protein
MLWKKPPEYPMTRKLTSATSSHIKGFSGEMMSDQNSSPKPVSRVQRSARPRINKTVRSE